MQGDKISHIQYDKSNYPKKKKKKKKKKKESSF